MLRTWDWKNLLEHVMWLFYERLVRLGILFQHMGASEMCCLGILSDRFWSSPSKYSLQFTV